MMDRQADGRTGGWKNNVALAHSSKRGSHEASLVKFNPVVEEEIS